MPDEKELFQTTRTTWSERAKLGELDAVLTASGNDRKNLLLHGTNLFVANRALKLLRRRGEIVDFGCGTGRFIRFFAAHGHSVIGTEVTKEMLDQVELIGLPGNCRVALTNGIDIPVRDGSVDLIWVCSVLRYSLNVPNPVYDQIAAEMYRVLKPGGRVVNIEIYVEQPVSDFTRDFEAAGFRTELVRVVHRHGGRLERHSLTRLPLSFQKAAGRSIAAWRYHFGSPASTAAGLRDYLFVWKKPD